MEVYLKASQKHVADKRNPAGCSAWSRSSPAACRRAPRTAARTRANETFITIDAPVVLPYSKPHASMVVGDLFGEMTCMNSYRRSATVRATEDCTVLEMLRNVLYIMQRSPAFRKNLEETYRDRAINNHLRSVPIFAGLRTDEAQFEQLVDYLREKVQLRRCEPGEVIFRQGARGDDGFYLVRSGFVKVSQARPGGEHVLNYVGPGGYFGEIAMMADDDEVRALAPPGRRTATCTALDHVDLVRISAADFRDILNRFPDQSASR